LLQACQYTGYVAGIKRVKTGPVQIINFTV